MTKIFFRGRIESGLGRGKKFICKNYYSSQIKRLFGFEPYPGTLNIKPEEKFLKRFNDLKEVSYFKIDSLSKNGEKLGAVKCFFGEIERFSCGFLIPEFSDHQDIFEVVSPLFLKEKLRVKDGDRINFYIDFEKEAEFFDVLKYSETLSGFNLCDRCLGRIFAKKWGGLENMEKGEKVREILANDGFFYKFDSERKCDLCRNIFEERDDFVNLILQKIKDYEFDTFLVGSSFVRGILKSEEEILGSTNSILSESVKKDLNREIGMRLEEITGKLVDFDNPEIMIILNTDFNTAVLQIKSLYFYGRYGKYRRDLPQTILWCRNCLGKGCLECENKGTIYKESVEELIGEEILKETEGKKWVFHGAGREDVDVLMLGNGRPFVIEIKNPKKRSVELLALMERINRNAKEKIAITGLINSNKKEVIRIKAMRASKIYEAEIEFESPTTKEKVKKAISQLRGSQIIQKTPLRVVHRRADIVRERRIEEIELNQFRQQRARLTIRAEAGTYIKELISGDDGRTQPSIAGLCDSCARVVRLDVVEICDL